MPRAFVNSLANFMIQGGIVSFTLQDQAVRTSQGQTTQAPPEDIAHVVMREGDFAQLVQLFNQHVQAFEKQMGRPLGAQPDAQAGGAAGAQRAPAAGPKAAGMKIKPKKG